MSDRKEIEVAMAVEPLPAKSPNEIERWLAEYTAAHLRLVSMQAKAGKPKKWPKGIDIEVKDKETDADLDVFSGKYKHPAALLIKLQRKPQPTKRKPQQEPEVSNEQNSRKREEFQYFLKTGDTYKGVPKTSIHEALPAGSYEVFKHPVTGEFFFTQIFTGSDKIVDLPNPVFKAVVGEMEKFMSPEVQALFEAEGFTYKRSTLLHGAAGTGKSVIVNRVAQRLVEMGGVVLFQPNPKHLPQIYRILDSIQPNTKTMVVFEEIDSLLEVGFEEDLLLLLDGQLQKNNVIYMATTNDLTKIPARLRRPGRFSTVVEAQFPDALERKFYLENKVKTKRDMIPTIVATTDGLSIDELREVVVSVVCLGQDLKSVVGRIRSTRAEAEKDSR